MNRRYERWQRGISVLTRRLDFVLVRLVFALLILLVLTQGLLRWPPMLHLYSNLDRSEASRMLALESLGGVGRLVNERTVSTETELPHVTLELVQPRPSKRVKLLINGEIVSSFAKSTITVPVNPGDLLEIDCLQESQPVTVRVKTIAGDLIQPLQGQYLQAQQEIRPLGRVTTPVGR
jgi:hypothetical protein